MRIMINIVFNYLLSMQVRTYGKKWVDKKRSGEQDVDKNL